MKLSGVIDALIASGGTPEQISAVVRAAEAEQEAADAVRREKAASKKRAERASLSIAQSVPGTTGDKLGQQGTQGDGKRQMTTGGDAPSPPPSPSPEPPTPPAPTPVDPRPPSGTAPKGAAAHRGSTLPDDWQPKAKHIERAAEGGQGVGFVANCADRMREWAGANRNRAIARKADWDLTFHGFLRRELERVKPPPQPPPGGKPQHRNPYFASAARDRQHNDQHKPPRDNVVQHPNAFAPGRGGETPLLDLRAEPVIERSVSFARRHAEC